MKNKHEIESFITYFQEEITKVSSIENNLYKKLLFSCIIDALGTARFPHHDTDQKMISFLLDCSPKAGLNRVSLIQLELFLNYTLSKQEKATSQLLQHVRQETAKMKEGHVYRGHDVDPFYNQLDKKSTSKEKTILKLARYVNLFYAYRNEMVHGFKEPGYPMEISDDDSNPYYHSCINEPWQLVFPPAFFQMLCTNAMNGLKHYLDTNDITPYDQYEFGDMWIKTKKLDKIKENT